MINYDVARDIDTHTHRIGRTGRAGVEGTAYTLVTEKDKEFAGHLVRNLEGANQEVPDALMKLALQSQWFKKARYKDSQAKKMNTKTGLGYKPGLGQQKDQLHSSSPNHNSHRNILPPSKSFSHQAHSSSTPTSRLEAMKTSYAAQFKSAFRPATESTPSIGSFNSYNTSNISSNNNESSSSNFEKPKKKSRWQ